MKIQPKAYITDSSVPYNIHNDDSQYLQYSKPEYAKMVATERHLPEKRQKTSKFYI
jgi:hypothetical protein